MELFRENVSNKNLGKSIVLMHHYLCLFRAAASITTSWTDTFLKPFKQRFMLGDREIENLMLVPSLPFCLDSLHVT